MKKKQTNPTNPWTYGNIPKEPMYVSLEVQKERKKSEIQKKKEEIMAENFPNVDKSINS